MALNDGSTSSTDSNTSNTIAIEGIPSDVNLWHVYNPRFHLVDLISTRRNPFSSTRRPPRPPNAFFLMKNCYMLETRLLGYRLAMPDLCRQAKLIWREIPQEVKDKYDSLALMAQRLHQEIYPNYVFAPKKRKMFKPYVPQSEQLGMGRFSATNVTKELHASSLEPSESRSANCSPQTRSPDIFLYQPQQETGYLNFENFEVNLNEHYFFPLGGSGGGDNYQYFYTTSEA